MKEFYLNTKRVSFHIWEPSDIVIAKQLWQDPEVSKYICAKGIFSEEEVENRLLSEVSNQSKYGVQYWPFLHANTHELIGCCGFRPYNSNGLEFGIHIRSPFWRRGYGAEAGSTAISYCLKNLQPGLITAGHSPKNTASEHLLIKLGFVFSHCEYYEPTGLNHPTYFYKGN